ncbi:spore germination protein GerW family protein [Streptomyces sp. MST-110588]|uniref:GerW family sporulation protein n=1 Tax=Streptomyces sp. MST-110588 TaxID=2833628 RepID=UPI001F5D7FC9|nr:spore germination protein GerW family protein [Streptomyces sp. MST-110588]UNO38634.1 sporulation protein [Streptomyces sp. MST-110588]
MTASEHASLEARTADQATADLLEQLAGKLGRRAPGTVVFGEPVVSQDVTVIPVARIGFGFGGNTGQAAGEDGLVGGGVEAKPLGFIEIKEGRTTYKPIRDPWVNVLLPLTGGLLAGAAIVRCLARRGGR